MSDAFIDLDTQPVAKKVPKSSGITVTQTTKIPSGYLPMELSTNGHFGVPKLFHIRNFTTSELLEISLFQTEALPEKIISILGDMIYEKSDVSQWPEKVIVELMIKIYANFFGSTLTDVDFPWNDEDVDWMISHEQEERVKDLKSGKFIPKTDIMLSNISTIDLGDDVKDKIVITKKGDDGINLKFLSFPRYGDSLLLRKYVKEKFSESDRQFNRIKQQWEILQKYMDESRDLNTLEPIDDNEYEDWQRNELEKAIWMTKASLAMYLVEFEGEDCSNRSLSDRIKFLDSPKISGNLYKKLQSHFNKVDFGIDPMVPVTNPITKEVSKRAFTFRLLDIVQTILKFEPDEYDIQYDD